VTRWRARVTAALCLAVLGLALAAPAWAHATLLSASPSDGARLDAPPADVVLEFSARIAPPAYVVVTAPDGTRTTGEAQVEGAVLTQSVTPGGDGAYTVAYRAISVDGHTVTGELGFRVGTTSTGAAPVPTAAPTSTAEDEVPAATAGAPTADTPGHGLAIGVGAGLFGLAGVLLLLSRRAPS
jgi:copper resistance protein C